MGKTFYPEQGVKETYPLNLTEQTTVCDVYLINVWLQNRLNITRVILLTRIAVATVIKNKHYFNIPLTVITNINYQHSLRTLLYSNSYQFVNEV